VATAEILHRIRMNASPGIIQPTCTDALREQADNIRPYSPGGKPVPFIVPVLSPVCTAPTRRSQIFPQYKTEI
jgi:hypothetical protein